jgi:hypothetical protein
VTEKDQAFLAEIRRALNFWWHDPVFVWGRPISRKIARTIERELQQ